MDRNRDASERITLATDAIPREKYGEAATAIADRFGLNPAGSLIEGFDEIFQDYSKGEALVGIEWDIWSGFTVVAKTPQAEELVEEIASYLDELILGNSGVSGKGRD